MLLNGDVRAVLLRVRGWLCQRWVSTMVVAAVVAVVCGTVLALAAGARRTSAAPDAFTAAVGGDADATVQQQSGAPRTAEVAALPGVAAVESMTFVFAGLVDSEHQSPIDALVFAGARPYASRLVAGRDPDPANPRQFVADQRFVADYDARLGDRYRLVTLTREQIERGAFEEAPEGPSFEAVLVGIVAARDALESEYRTVVFSPALLDEDVEVAATIMTVRLDPSVTTDEFRAMLDGLPDGSALSLGPGQIVSGEVRNAVEAQGQATWLMAAVAAVAAVVALGQLLTRHVRLSDVERQPLRALGFTRGQLAVETVMRAAVPAAAGVATGAAVAVAASGLFPAGFVRVLDPHPGPRLDVGTLGVGGGVLLAAVLAWIAAAVLTTGAARAPRPPSRTAALFAERAPGPEAATGTRFALTARDGSSTAALGTLFALAVLVAGVVGAAVFAASHDRLVSDRGRFGTNYDFAVGDNTELSAAELRTALQGALDIAGLMILTGGQVRAGGQTVGLVGVEHVHGDLAPSLLAGRLPAGPDEVALGRVAARQLHLSVGDDVTLAGSDGRGSYRVVGLAVVPTIGGNDGVGQGGVVTAEGFSRLDQDPDTTMAAIVLRDDAAPDADRRVAGLVGVQPGNQDMPSSIINIARVRRIPGILAVILAVLATLTMVHALIVSIQRRRRDLAVLRALGADRRWIGRAVRWQATVLTALPLVVGVPLGVIAGSAMFRAFADRIGALSDPTVPVVVFVATVTSLIAIANLAAFVPARRARRLSTAETLRDE
jgi:putative ABC transport system permease protein